ncbi:MULTISPECIES: tRNA (adenosine(37)-N6)-threonylcarbamoyltransferase complex transferase subunit TsaD [Caproicibacterium]|uniref:N(6)-L-threonylcarbamoyladenine synthase n=1 Tax=Caproicibacterium argilliputei TaxID=3030016 RepID=A0AA97H308_9FIRM|nr:peptidase M22 [Caproicibacterium argilliputei]WOC33315.1 peptidase M22 [Caproicibacterium argilliputei]
MADIFALDTSNYTTSTALFRDGEIFQQKQLLPVRKGELGLRQSDAVFHHVQQLPELTEALFAQTSRSTLQAVGCSSRPRTLPGSYMPCFTVGHGAARLLAAVHGVPLYTFSHQQGHIAAALWSAQRLDLFEKPFLAFHVSGGTTEAVLAAPAADEPFHVRLLAQSLDLKGGQAVDRVGRLLGLPFPAGPELEKLAAQSDAAFRIRPSMKGADCSLSGIENQCARQKAEGVPPQDIAKYCLCSLLAALDAMAAALLREHPGLPLVFAGGVMSNRFIRTALTEKYGACFAEPAFSADNAAGIAVLTARREGLL